VRDIHLPERCQPSADVRVFAVKFDRAVEPVDARERITPHGEVAAVQNRADAERVMHHPVRRWSDDDVIGADERASHQVPVEEPIRSRHRDGGRPALEPPLYSLEPGDWRPAVGVQVGEDVAPRGKTGCLACDDEPAHGLVDHTDARHRPCDVAGAIRARIVHDDDFVGRAGLGEQRVQAR